MQAGAETATATAGDGGGAAVTNGGHQEGGAGATLDVAATGDEESRGRGGEELGGGGGNRWPRQETVELLKIRSDMDEVFRDSSQKGPLWEEVSRKMAEMGYRRSAKKCKEKFENVFKYHKRTKEGRAAKADGKTYRFFDQLEAFGATHPVSSLFSSGLPSPPVEAAVPLAMAIPPPRPPPPLTTQPQVTVPSTKQPLFQQVTPAIHHILPPVPLPQNANPMGFPSSPSGTPTSSSSTSSDEEVTGMRKKRKRKWKDFFERLTMDVMEKQELLHRKFLEALEKRENERRAREEAWKAQEMARLKRQHEILVQERSMAVAKDSALISFLQKLSEKQQIPLPSAPIAQLQPLSQPPLQPPTPTIPAPVPAPIPAAIAPAARQSQHNVEPVRTINGDQVSGGYTSASTSRWPKAEVEALIKLRTDLEHKYEENGPKGPLWEEISAAMRRLGYNRDAKRCKEKWENINKYFKRMKESNKKRREDSKSCPYYHQLEVLYREKSSLYTAKTRQPTVTVAAEQEKQWPVPPPPPQEQDMGIDNEEENDDEDEDDEEEDDQGGEYEIVANNSSAAAMGGAKAAMGVLD